jgi:hypothetical protein
MLITDETSNVYFAYKIPVHVHVNDVYTPAFIRQLVTQFMKGRKSNNVKMDKKVCKSKYYAANWLMCSYAKQSLFPLVT